MKLNLFSFTQKEDGLIGRIITDATNKQIDYLGNKLNDNQLIMTYEDYYHELKYYLQNYGHLCLELKEYDFKFLHQDKEEKHFNLLEIEI
jgi:hypothetical protein